MRVPPPSIRFVSDQSLLIQWSGPPSMEINHWVSILFRRLAASRWEIENLHPAYSSLLVDFSPDTSPDEFAAAVRDLCDELRYGETMPGDEVQIEVIYDGADLDEISRQTGLSLQEIIRLHAEAEYHVAFLGFSPGFPYLMGLKEKLFCRRKEVPRMKVPAGSVAIAGFQTGIYPNESPGGWQLLGRTDATLFNPENEKPSLLSPGDRVRFVPRTSPENISPRAERKSSWPGHSLCEVLNPGPFTTVQDRGRLNQAHLGVSRGGAADPLALAVGNMLLGNSNRAAALEMTIAGGTFRFLRDTWIALAGARMPAQIDGQSVEMWQALPVNAGQTLALGAAEGLRTYLCVRGGFAAQEILDSRATCVSGGWGGWEGRALREGDLLRSEDAAAKPPTFRGRSLTLRRMYAEEISVLRVTRGPQWDRFSDQARELFFSREFKVTDECNRLGLRLHGPLLEPAASQRELEILSEGIANGAVQVPSGGSPIILFCEQTTTGGYPKIANVIHADFFRLGQLKPGDKFHFKEVTREEARRLAQELDGSLQSLGFTR